MKNKIIFKSTLVGLLIGIIVSINMMFVGFGVSLISTVSLAFLLHTLLLDVGRTVGWIFVPIFFITVYTLYGFIIGVLIKKIKKG